MAQARRCVVRAWPTNCRTSVSLFTHTIRAFWATVRLNITVRIFAINMPSLHSLRVLLGLLVTGLLMPSLALASAFAPLQGARYQMQVKSQLEPVVINHIHAWELELRDANGVLVSDATITVDGGMPAHHHGLPTAPRVTEVLGPGRYLLEGMKFQMGGQWEVRFQIEAAAGTETLTLEFAL